MPYADKFYVGKTFQVNLGYSLLENLEKIVKFVAIGITNGILLSKFEYRGSNAIGK